MGDDLDIANLIAEEVGGPVPEAAAAGDSQTTRLQQLSARLEAAENAFDILGLSAESAIDELRSAYMDLASQLHPDKYTDVGAEVQEQAKTKLKGNTFDWPNHSTNR